MSPIEKRKGPLLPWIIAVSVGVCASGSVARAAGLLDQPCPIEWRATPLGQAVQNLAERLSVPYVLDTSVTDEMLKGPVRLVAAHLTGRQAFRWTARSVGLDAVLVDGAMLIAKPDRLPLTWRATGIAGGEPGQEPSPGGNPPAADSDRSTARAANQRRSPWEQAQTRPAELTWVDAPLSRVARDISVQFGVDAVFDPIILAQEPLVRLEGTGLDWASVRKVLAEQLRATSRYDDGALWIEPAGAAGSGPAVEQAETAPAPGTPGRRMVLLARPVSIEPGAGWKGLEQAFSRATGVACRIEHPHGVEPPSLAARGSVSEVLAAMKMLAGWTWRIDRSDAAGRRALVIVAPGPGRLPK